MLDPDPISIRWVVPEKTAFAWLTPPIYLCLHGILLDEQTIFFRTDIVSKIFITCMAQFLYDFFFQPPVRTDKIRLIKSDTKRSPEMQININFVDRKLVVIAGSFCDIDVPIYGDYKWYKRIDFFLNYYVIKVIFSLIVYINNAKCLFWKCIHNHNI